MTFLIARRSEITGELEVITPLHVGSGEDAEDDAILVLEEDKAELKRGKTSPRLKTRPPRHPWAALYSRLFVQLHVHHDHDEDE